MIRELMNSVDEREIIRKKKREYRVKGIRLRTHVKNEVSVITSLGHLNYSRYLLIPEDIESKGRLMGLSGLKSIAPLDSHLGLGYPSR
jgi:hypothetical protein